MDHPNSPDQAGREGTRVEPTPLEVEGRVLGGRYRLLRRLGIGGMGTVWLCEHVGLGRRYALKVLSAERAANPALLARFRQEARAASGIVQENVVDVVDSGEDAGGEHFYVMEVLDGRSLGQVLREDGPLPVGRALLLLEQVCQALAAAHGRGVIHCDVKPDNLLVQRLPDGREQAKLIDFGISRLPGVGRLTRDGEIIGTPEYMSPEQAAGEAVDERTDVYATGVLAFELLTGCLPLVGPTAIATLVAHQTTAPEPPGRRRPGLGPAIDRLVLRALEKRPADRFPSMQAMAAEVMRVRLVAGLGDPAPQEPAPVAPVPTLPLPAASGRARAGPPARSEERPASRPARARVRWPGAALALLGITVAVVALVMAAEQWTRPAPPVPRPVTAAPTPVAEEPAQPIAPRPIDEEPSAKGPVRPARPAGAEPPARDPYAAPDTLKADPFR
jgi:serine/threonine-protein kinase